MPRDVEHTQHATRRTGRASAPNFFCPGKWCGRFALDGFEPKGRATGPYRFASVNRNRRPGTGICRWPLHPTTGRRRPLAGAARRPGGHNTASENQTTREANLINLAAHAKCAGTAPCQAVEALPCIPSTSRAPHYLPAQPGNARRRGS